MHYFYRFVLVCACVFAGMSSPLSAQSPSPSSSNNFTLLGRMSDSTQKPLSGVRIVLLRGAIEPPPPSQTAASQPRTMSMDPSTFAGGAVSDKDGAFALPVKGAGTYTLIATSVGFSAFRKIITLDKQDTVRLPAIVMKSVTVKTDAVEVSEQAARAEVKGDTVEYNAAQFKTERNAVAEDLVRKMPGVQVESDGSVKAQGETIRRVIVDGKPFFGDDPRTALKNLPADMIDRVQVIDQMSEQSRFSGFDDGDRTKTLNIVTKPDRRNGQFGKVYGGAGGSALGAEARYTAGGNVNFFGGDRRISVLGLSNNINQQNFSIQDILGTMGGGGGGGMNTQVRTMMGGAMSSGAGAAMRAAGGGGGGVGSPGDFLVPQSDGITAAHSLGVNYADKWGQNFDVAASYFGNFTNNYASQNALRQTLLSEGVGQRTRDESTSLSNNLNHRINARLEYTLDSNNSFVLTPTITFQNNQRTTLSTNATRMGEGGAPLNASTRENDSRSEGVSVNNELLWRHRFNAEGRTLSVSQRTAWNRNDGVSRNDAMNIFYRFNPMTMNLDSAVQNLNQNAPSLSNSLSLGGNVAYTEPLSTQSMLQASYNINQTRTESDRQVKDFNPTTGEFSLLNKPLSNLASSLYSTHRPGLTYRINLSTGASLSVGADYQYARLDVNQTFPTETQIFREFQNVLPSLVFTMRLGNAPAMGGGGGGGRPPFGGGPGGAPFGGGSGPSGGGGPMMMMFGAGNPASMLAGPVGNLRVNYRAFTNAPGIRQLQNVVDNTNPVRLTVGNPELKQEVTHNLTANIGLFDMRTATSVFAFVSASYTADKIANSTLITVRDTTVQNTNGGEAIRLGRGAQLTRYTNLNDYWNVRAFAGYNFPWEPVQGFKLNISLNAGGSYVRDVSLINDALNASNTYGITPQIAIGSNISENLDFNISGRTSYNIVRNSLQSALDNEYFIHSINARLNWIFWEGFLISADFNYLANVGLVGGFNQTIPLLNIGVGKRFFDGNGELKLSVFDALNLNNSITRNVTSSFIEDTQTNVLQRYFLLTFTYNLRAFGQK
ncbi:MAG: hypothetical protein EAZ92_09315 [Candidatus Kapaibacterium sp.]|nr:MAG: hypothetical protein EAZ92_09315 [Candidatus Kapabacteria bacterium]